MLLIILNRNHSIGEKRKDAQLLQLNVVKDLSFAVLGQDALQITWDQQDAATKINWLLDAHIGRLIQTLIADFQLDKLTKLLERQEEQVVQELDVSYQVSLKLLVTQLYLAHVLNQNV